MSYSDCHLQWSFITHQIRMAHFSAGLTLLYDPLHSKYSVIQDITELYGLYFTYLKLSELLELFELFSLSRYSGRLFYNVNRRRLLLRGQVQNKDIFDFSLNYHILH